jgi:predicted nucleic acid-binding protein
MGPVRIFLDANILFSAALGGRSFALLWELARAEKVTLLTSRYCRIEAERNLSRKRPASLKAFGELLEWVAELSGGRGMEQGMKGTEGDVQLPEKDRPTRRRSLLRLRCS